MDMLDWFAGAEYTHHKKRKKTSNKEAPLRETFNRAAITPSAEPAAAPALPAAAAGDADSDALPLGKKVEWRGKEMMKHQKKEDGVSLSSSIPLSSKEKKSSKAFMSSCVTGSPLSLDDVPTPSNGQQFHTGDDKLKQVGKVWALYVKL